MLFYVVFEKKNSRSFLKKKKEFIPAAFSAHEKRENCDKFWNSFFRFSDIDFVLLLITINDSGQTESHPQHECYQNG